MLELCDMDINITVTNMPQEYNGNVVDINGNLETMKEILRTEDSSNNFHNSALMFNSRRQNE